MSKRAALYMRVSTLDQHPDTQILDLHQMAAQRGYQIVEEFTDRISGTKAKRTGLVILAFWFGPSRPIRCGPGLSL